MGFLNRNKPATPPAKAVRPVIVQPADLPGFSKRLDAVMNAMGGRSDPMYEAIGVLAESVGGFDALSKEGLQLMSQNHDMVQETTRPWRWFARASELANELGDYSIAPRVWVFAFWFKGIEPNLNIQASRDLRMDGVPTDAFNAIATAADEALAQLPDEYIVANTAAEVLSAAYVRGSVGKRPGTP
jgi:hypothetical protein